MGSKEYAILDTSFITLLQILRARTLFYINEKIFDKTKKSVINEEKPPLNKFSETADFYVNLTKHIYPETKS